MEEKSVLITGGSGLIGRNLTRLLLSRGYKVSHLSRSGKSQPGTELFFWDPVKRKIDPLAFRGISHIVHLAGANVGEKRWSKKRKEEIISSRVSSAEFLFSQILENSVRIKTFISASATGYYGSGPSEKTFTETDPPGDDFLASVCRKWEEAATSFMNSGIRTIMIRTAVVLDKSDSALSKILKVSKSGILPVFGSGNQPMPWIHIDDLCKIYLLAIENTSMAGPFNAASPQIINNRDFSYLLRGSLKRPSVIIHIPSFLISLMLGEMSVVVLGGRKISAVKVINSGYEFSYPDLSDALKSIISS
jgi:uncharacterized protein (TIGR01777 family)